MFSKDIQSYEPLSHCRLQMLSIWTILMSGTEPKGEYMPHPILGMSSLTILNPFPNFLGFDMSAAQVIWKLLVSSNFSFSHSVFYSFGKLSAIFIKSEIVVCKPFKFGGVYNLLYAKGLRTLSFSLRLCKC